MRYKSAFIDSDSTKSSQWGIAKINGDELARQITAALNEMAYEGYELDHHILINSSPNTFMEGIVLVCKKSDDKEKSEA